MGNAGERKIHCHGGRSATAESPGPTYNIAMKTIQITMDEELLARLDKAEEVRQLGRSAVLRRATGEYLARQRRVEIARQYRKAYGAHDALGDEFKGWEDEAAWMNE